MIDRYSYPFTAIVGQDEMKLALVLNAINPTIGGVLIRGEKGTGKSTAVRALARLLPEQQVVEGCHFGCHPDDPEDWCADCRARSSGGALPVATRRMRVVGGRGESLLPAARRVLAVGEGADRGADRDLSRGHPPSRHPAPDRADLARAGGGRAPLRPRVRPCRTGQGRLPQRG